MALRLAAHRWLEAVSPWLRWESRLVLFQLPRDPGRPVHGGGEGAHGDQHEDPEKHRTLRLREPAAEQRIEQAAQYLQRQPLRTLHQAARAGDADRLTPRLRVA